MLIMRIDRKGRWTTDRSADNPAHVEDAAGGLELDPGEEGLSVFRAEGELEQREVAVRFAMTCRQRPANLDYVVFSSELALNLGLTICHVPQEGLDPYLSERHCEIRGLTTELGRRLAASILAENSRRVERLREREIPMLGAQLCRKVPQLHNYLRGRWAEVLAKLSDNLPGNQQERSGQT